MYDGGDIHSPVIGHLCGVAHHAELWSSSASLLIEFYSSNVTAHTFEGFEARFQFLAAVEHPDDYGTDEDDEDEEDEAPRGTDDDYDATPAASTSVPPATTSTSVRPSTTRRTRTSLSDGS